MLEQTDDEAAASTPISVQKEECNHSVMNLVGANRVLDEVAKRGLDKCDQEALRKYFDYHRKRERGFAEAFRRDFAVARDVYLNQDNDRAILAYAIGLIAFIAAIALPFVDPLARDLISGAAILLLIALSIPCIMTLWRGLEDKREKRFENMEQFYRYINSHALNAPLVIDEE